MVNPAGRAAGKRDLCDVGLHGGGEILCRLDRRIRRHHDHLDLLGEARDRRHLFERHRRFVHGERAHHDEAVDHQLVAVALGAVDELRDADAATGAGDIRHLDAARDLGGDQRLLHRARGLIPSAAGGRGRHDLQLELLRKGRRAGCKRQCDGRAEQARGERNHGASSRLTASRCVSIRRISAGKRAAVQKDSRLSRPTLHGVVFAVFVFDTCSGQARATACGNTISISVPERPPVLI